MHQDESYVLRSLKAGAKGYLLKDSLRADVIEAIRTVSQGRSFLTRKVSRMLQEDYIRQMERRGLEDSYDLLTDREREILQLVAEGRTNKEVADAVEYQPHHGGDSPHAHPAKTGPAQRSGTDSVRRAEGDYLVGGRAGGLSIVNENILHGQSRSTNTCYTKKDFPSRRLSDHRYY